ncbi:MAG: type II toxin-antitoxin system MqsA family antitoxin [Defluviitaleaceae bacterium]|nr:type II toxin-antitoxin system MqsA family antitoxin [Defluviitaleaceae bacterium]MCL2274613.1 type II toxin-antitoxin system MqsA family antitoxin [Defluviitaleaceae bacterium]
MNCFMCKGSIKNDFTTFMVDLGACIIIVKNVPSQVCSQCGEASYTHEVTKKLESIVSTLRESITEIAVVNYASKAA